MCKEKNKKKQSTSFESSLKELEEIVSHLEPGSLSLEEALNEFERGIQIAKQAQKVLKEAEQRVKILLIDDENQSLDDFSVDTE
ncbi:Exodeoxyribonuclease 7 small subunit [Candidatus Hartigia pinicola]|nr:Exodeoxyribonuclease 7 small subunit [Candidatus Hartigia pinicola]